MTTTHNFVCPRSRLPLTMSPDGSALESPEQDRYPVIDGIPLLLVDAGQVQAGADDQTYYRIRADEYDQGNDIMFRMLLSDEGSTRDTLIGMLQVKHDARVLEVGCGTCRDTIRLLDHVAEVYASDLSREMLLVGRERLNRAGADESRVSLFVADATQLPFADQFFDAAYHFGGLNFFSDIGQALQELARVVKPGGRVVVGDEGVAPWLRNTEFSKILMNSNPLFGHTAPLDKVPVGARDATCRWVLNGSFYVISFEVAEGEPKLDLDVRFPGWRGGSHRTRYFGKLEGVAPELKDKIVRAAAVEGIAIADWLERELGKAVEKDED